MKNFLLDRGSGKEANAGGNPAPKVPMRPSSSSGSVSIEANHGGDGDLIIGSRLQALPLSARIDHKKKKS